MRYVTHESSLPQGNYTYVLTDHSEEIRAARRRMESIPSGKARTDVLAACELLECHDATGISLDDWRPVRLFVESTLGFKILENHV